MNKQEHLRSLELEMCRARRTAYIWMSLLGLIVGIVGYLLLQYANPLDNLGIALAHSTPMPPTPDGEMPIMVGRGGAQNAIAQGDGHLLPTPIPEGQPTPTPLPLPDVVYGNILTPQPTPQAWPTPPPVTYPNSGQVTIPGSGLSAVGKISHYRPWDGGVNCGVWDYATSTCISNTASGKPWKPLLGQNALACPRQYAFGTRFVINGEIWSCWDRGGAIIVEANGDIWLDLLIERPVVGGVYIPYGTRVDIIILPPP